MYVCMYTQMYIYIHYIHITICARYARTQILFFAYVQYDQLLFSALNTDSLFDQITIIGRDLFFFAFATPRGQSDDRAIKLMYNVRPREGEELYPPIELAHRLANSKTAVHNTLATLRKTAMASARDTTLNQLFAQPALEGRLHK